MQSVEVQAWWRIHGESKAPKGATEAARNGNGGAAVVCNGGVNWQNGEFQLSVSRFMVLTGFGRRNGCKFVPGRYWE